MKYIGFYDIDNSKELRIKAMSAKNKMDYVSKALNEIGYDVEIISPSWTLGKNFFPGKVEKIGNKNTLVLGPTILYIRYLSHFVSLVWLIIYLLRNVKQNETILVYHTVILMPVIKLLKKIKKVKVLLEVEEIYSEVFNKNQRSIISEKNYIKFMDARILVSDMLKSKIGIDSDIVLYGSYTSKVQKVNRKPYSLVYAGSLDHIKGGAFNAINLMKGIKNESVTLTILGGGTEIEVNRLKNEINKLNSEKGYAAIEYLGQKVGKEFDDLMNTFEVGVNLQNQGQYMDTAFPSKILTYLSYGLQVISSSVQSIEESPFSTIIEFVDIDNYEKMTDEVDKILLKNKKIDNGNIIEQFHKKFCFNLKFLIHRIKEVKK